MGNWNISIRGVGAHHGKFNGQDANRMAARFVKELKNAGHTVVASSITFGGEESLDDPDKYLADREALESAG